MNDQEGRSHDAGRGGGDADRMPQPESPPRHGPPPLQWNNFITTVQQRRTDVALWITRLVTIGFGIFYLIPLPIFGYDRH